MSSSAFTDGCPGHTSNAVATLCLQVPHHPQDGVMITDSHRPDGRFSACARYVAESPPNAVQLDTTDQGRRTCLEWTVTALGDIRALWTKKGYDNFTYAFTCVFRLTIDSSF